MSTGTLQTSGAPVSYPDLAREIGLTYRQRADILRTGLVDPVNGTRRPGYTTWITPESAELVKEAKRIVDEIRQNPVRSLAVGVSIVVVLRLLAAGAVKPSVP
jgi:hypothetical protein